MVRYTFIHIRNQFSTILDIYNMSYERRSGYSGRGSYGGGGGYSRHQFNSSSPKPVEVGKEYDVQVIETSQRGDGIARIQGFVIFVKNGKAGENLKIKIISVGSRFAIAEIVNN
jgi:predicted RNA-binding protein with TRAM domain